MDDGLFEVQASFVSTRGRNVQLRIPDGQLVAVSLDQLSHNDQHWIEDRQAEIRQLNQSPPLLLALAPKDDEPDQAPEIAKAFEAFAKLKTITYRWDDRYFYVESNGMPDHPMMIGITAWQQQVPLPQKYFGLNAWQIPLHPVPASEPASAKNRFLRGAMALAVNGVPMFNPLNNRGDDAYLFGELDEYGGHCGRGDDYHYHIAPVHLQKKVGKQQPIAYALDGYPIYGYDEADGSKVEKLDSLNGHHDADGRYHYHATKTYPYINGGFHGEVTERAGQVDPQPRAEPVREGLPPLRGAKVVAFTAPEENCYLLTYEVSGRRGTVEYSIKADGSVAFAFTDPVGKETHETYQPRRRPPGRPAGGNGRPPRPDENRPQSNANRPTPQGDPPTALASNVGGNATAQLTVTSSAFAPNGEYPKEFTCDGLGVSPPISWSGAPQGTKSFAVSMWHTAPDREKSYWLIYNISSEINGLEKNAKSVGTMGINDMRRAAYESVCSKGPGLKKYHITVYALSAEVELKPDQANRPNLLDAIRDITLAEGTLSFQYQRQR